MEFSIKGVCGLIGVVAVTLWSCGSKQTAEEKRKADSLAACIADGMPSRASAIRNASLVTEGAGDSTGMVWIPGGKFLMGADEFPENVLDKLHLTSLLKVKSFFGQLMDKSLWFTHWPAIQNVSGQPSIALPVHVTETGLPLGIQAAGRLGDEETLLSFAAQMEKVSGWLGRRGPLKVPG